MKRLRTLIVDDDMIARKVMHHMLEEHETVSIIGEAATALEAIALANQHRPDLLFLDIEMPTMNGFSLLSSLDYTPQVVFVTAYSTYAVEAFDVDAIDYLVKPFSSERLARALLRLSEATSQKPTTTKDDIIYIRDCGQMHAIHRCNITAITADSNFTRIHLVDSQPLFIRKAIGDWEKILPKPMFIRLNRSLIVNTQQIDKKKVINRDKALLYVNGVSEPFVLKRIALLRFRKLADTFANHSGKN